MKNQFWNWRFSRLIDIHWIMKSKLKLCVSYIAKLNLRLIWFIENNVFGETMTQHKMCLYLCISVFVANNLLRFPSYKFEEILEKDISFHQLKHKIVFCFEIGVIHVFKGIIGLNFLLYRWWNKIVNLSMRKNSLLKKVFYRF